MSASWDKAMARLDALEREVRDIRASFPTNYDAPARRRDDEIDRRIDRACRVTEIHPLQPFESVFNEDGSWSVTNLVDLRSLDPPTATLAQTARALGTLISVLAAHKRPVSTTAAAITFSRCAHVAGDFEKLASVELSVSSEFTFSATDYWTFTVWRQAADQQYGEGIATYSTSDRTIPAFGTGDDSTVVLYSNAVGLDLAPGDTIRVEVDATGAPAALSDPSIRYTIQRRTR